MSEVLHGNASGNQLNAGANKTQVYGLQGNDTLTSGDKSDVLLVGGSGNDSLVMSGGNGTLAGGAGSDTFELSYSATKKISAVIEDLDPANDKIIVNFDGSTLPQLTSSVSGSDVVWSDSSGNFSLTIKGVRENDYFDGTTSDEVWKVLKFTNDERDAQGKSLLTFSAGLTAGASVRAEEITELGTLGLLTDHTRPNGTNFSTVFDEVGKHYANYAENLDGGAATAAQAVEQWMSSQSHREHILNDTYKKLGVGFNYNDPDPTNHRYYWTQLFGDTLTTPETVSTDILLTANMTTATVSRGVTLTEGNDTYSNTSYGATINALGGNDSITNSNVLVSISGGNDSDTINNSGSFTTINAGSGNDSIRLNSSAQEVLIQYASGDGSDTISGLNPSDTVSISGAEFTPATVGSDIVIAVGDDSITLTGAAANGVQLLGSRSKLIILTENRDEFENTIDGAMIQALGGGDYVENYGANMTLDAGDGDDEILNEGANASIDGGAGNEYVINHGARSTLAGGDGSDTLMNEGANVSIGGNVGDDLIYNTSLGSGATLNGGAGNDYFINNGERVTILGDNGDDTLGNFGVNVSIDGGNGNDSIINSADGANVTIDAGNGNDSIMNDAASVSIDAGEYNDYISNIGSNVSISGGLGNDSIRLLDGAQNNVIDYTSGDGSDSIRGFNATSTLRIGNGTGTYSTQTSGDDVVVNVGINAITLLGAASLPTVNIVGTESSGEESTPSASKYIVLSKGNETYRNSLEGATIAA